MLNKFVFLIIISISFNIGNTKPKFENMTLREKIAQMIMVRVRGDFYNSEN